jgi:hypothetical protein
MFARALPIAVVLFAFGCEKTDHDSIDKWTRTEKGPDKLRRAFVDESIDPDLSAHAGANMIRKTPPMDAEFRTDIERMSPARRTAVIAKLTPRLWEIARVEGEDKLPSPPQSTAKEALLVVRKYADESQKAQIDGYLIDWYCVVSYERRAEAGNTPGAAVIRMLGPPAGKKLISVMNGVIAAPGQTTRKNKIGDQLLLGLAVSGSPDAVKYVLEIARMTDRGDKDLAARAMTALFKAYIDPQGEFTVVDPAALVPNLDGLVAIAKDDRMPGQAANDAIELIRAVGAPKCLAPLVGMIGYPHKDPRFKYSIPNNALRCGGVKAIKEVIQAVPDGPYDKEDLVGAIAGEVARQKPREEAQGAARDLLAQKGKIQRWVAIEALAKMKSAEDAQRIAAIGNANDKLIGFWGDQSEVAPKDRKEDPTLGQRAKELARQLAGGK